MGGQHFFEMLNSIRQMFSAFEELLYAPTAAVVFDKESTCWQMNLSLPMVPISPDVWPRVKSATEDVLEFWEDVRKELPDDGQWWSEADAS